MFKGGQIKTAALLGLMSGLLVLGGYWATGNTQGALNRLADEASSSENLPGSKKLFLENLNNE